MELKCEFCEFCQYPRTVYDNGGLCKCKAMKRKTIDVYVGGGETPEWCPLKKDKAAQPPVRAIIEKESGEK